MRGRIRLLFSYLSILVIGILIYLVVLFAADKHKKDKEMLADSSASMGESGLDSSANVADSSANASEIVVDSSQNPSIVDKESLNELPNEINVALDSIDSPKDFGDLSNNNVANNAKGFPKNFVVNTKILRIRTQPSTDSAIIKHFKLGAIISVLRIEGKWAELENGGWAYLPLLKEQK